MASSHITNAAIVAIALVALVGILGIVSVTNFGITGAAAIDSSVAGWSSDGVLSVVVILLGVGLGYMYLRKGSR